MDQNKLFDKIRGFPHKTRGSYLNDGQGWERFKNHCRTNAA